MSALLIGLVQEYAFGLDFSARHALRVATGIERKSDRRRKDALVLTCNVTLVAYEFQTRRRWGGIDYAALKVEGCTSETWYR